MKGIGKDANVYVVCISPPLGQGCIINIYMKIIYNTQVCNNQFFLHFYW